MSKVRSTPDLTEIRISNQAITLVAPTVLAVSVSVMDTLFSDSKLDVIVPDSAFELPEPFSPDGPGWLASIASQRDVAFFGQIQMS